MRFTARNKFSRNLVHKKDFGLKLQLVLKLENFFCQESKISLLNSNQLGKKSWTTFVLRKASRNQSHNQSFIGS